MIEHISSIKDPRIILARELQSSAGRKKHNKILLFGLEQIKWAMNAKIAIPYVFAQHEVPELNLPFLLVSAGILKKISDTNYVVPYIAVAEIPQSKEIKNNEFILVLDDIKDFGNLGTIIRTAQGFSVDTFVFSHMQTDPFQRKAIDSSRGSVFESNFIYEQNAQHAIDTLKNKGFQLVVTSPHAQRLQSQAPINPNKPIALVVGNETKGVAQSFIDQADVNIRIPMGPAVESLNVGVATGISIYELRFKQVLLMLKEKIFTNFGREVNLLGKYIQMAFDKEISAVTSLNGKQVILMMIMHCDQTMSLEQISRDTALHGNELEQLLAPLLEKKYIIKKENAYQLTSEGGQFLAEIWPVVEQTQRQIFSKLNEDEVEQFLHLMKQIKTSCLEIIQKQRQYDGKL